MLPRLQPLGRGTETPSALAAETQSAQADFVPFQPRFQQPGLNRPGLKPPRRLALSTPIAQSLSGAIHVMRKAPPAVTCRRGLPLSVESL